MRPTKANPAKNNRIREKEKFNYYIRNHNKGQSLLWIILLLVVGGLWCLGYYYFYGDSFLDYIAKENYLIDFKNIALLTGVFVYSPTILILLGYFLGLITNNINHPAVRSIKNLMDEMVSLFGLVSSLILVACFYKFECYLNPKWNMVSLDINSIQAFIMDAKFWYVLVIIFLHNLVSAFATCMVMASPRLYLAHMRRQQAAKGQTTKVF